MVQTAGEVISRPSRPGGVTLTAALCVLLGLFKFCFAPAHILLVTLFNVPMFAANRNDSFLFYDMVIDETLSWFAAVILIALGLGLLRLKNWARKATIFFALLAAVMRVVSGVFEMIFVTPRVIAGYVQSQVTPMTPGEIQFQSVMHYVRVSAVLLMVFCFYVFIALYLRRAKVRAAFH